MAAPVIWKIKGTKKVFFLFAHQLDNVFLVLFTKIAQIKRDAWNDWVEPRRPKTKTCMKHRAVEFLTKYL